MLSFFPLFRSQWVSMWPSLMYLVTKSGFLLGDSYWWVSNYELMVYYVKINFELKTSFASENTSSLLSLLLRLSCTVWLLNSLNRIFTPRLPEGPKVFLWIYIDNPASCFNKVWLCSYEAQLSKFLNLLNILTIILFISYLPRAVIVLDAHSLPCLKGRVCFFCSRTQPERNTCSQFSGHNKELPLQVFFF